MSRPVTSSGEAYAAGVRGWACEIPEGNVQVVSDSSGPIERRMETLPALAVQHVSIAESYRIGRALRFIGFVLDQEQQRIKIGERAHRALNERSSAHNHSGTLYTAEQLADDFLAAFGQRLSQEAGYIRDRILTYANTKVAFRQTNENLTDLGPSAVEARRRSIQGYSHPDVENLTESLIPVITAFHVSGPLYDDLERSGWTQMPTGTTRTGFAFTIMVDGEPWVPLSDDPEILARTEYLLVDARASTWTLCERVWMRRRDGDSQVVQTMGLQWDTQTGETAPMLADAAYTITGNTASRWDFTQYEQDRMRRVALGFSVLLVHAKVTIKSITSPPNQGDHFQVELPLKYTVDRVIDDINSRRHTR